MDDNIIFKTHQHIAVLVLKILRVGLIPGIIAFFVLFIIGNIIFAVIGLFLIFLIVFGYFYFFWSKSYFVITKDRLFINVRNGLFSKYDMSIHFDQIKDIAYSKNHILHYTFDYGVLFIRSSAGAEGNFTVPDIPNIENVYNKVNMLYALGDKRKVGNIIEEKPKNKEDTIEKNKNILLNITGIKEVEILTNEDKKYIFENEEDKNHGVYECIKRQVTLVFTHDAKFRNADAPIVLKLGNKVIFPPVSFHEVKEKNVVSSSPGMEVHEYLSKKFKNLGEYDATVLVGFDL